MVAGVEGNSDTLTCGGVGGFCWVTILSAMGLQLLENIVGDAAS